MGSQISLLPAGSLPIASAQALTMPSNEIARLSCINNSPEKAKEIDEQRGEDGIGKAYV